MQVVLSHVGIRNIGFGSFESNFRPGFDVLDSFIVPYGLTVLGGALRARGHGVEYLDLRMVRDWEDVETRLREIKPVALGIGFQTPNREYAVRLSEIAKSLDIPTIAGGPHVSCVPEDGLGVASFDHIVVGEGDTVLPDLCEAIGRGAKPARLIYAEPLKEIESAPLPYLSSVYEEMVRRKQVGFIVTSRGCPGKCKYCQPVQRTLYGNRVKFRSAANIMREIEYYVEELGVRKFFLMDDMFTVNRARVNELTSMLKERGSPVEYDINARVDFFDQDMCDRLASSGCNLVSFGFESGSDRKLKLMNKQTTRRENLAAGKIWKGTGKLLLANILAAIPGETEEDLEQDFAFVKELDPQMCYFNLMVPFPGSTYYQELLEQDMLLTKDFNMYEMKLVRTNPLVKGVDYEMVLKWERIFKEAFGG